MKNGLTLVNWIGTSDELDNFPGRVQKLPEL